MTREGEEEKTETRPIMILLIISTYLFYPSGSEGKTEYDLSEYEKQTMRWGESIAFWTILICIFMGYTSQRKEHVQRLLH